MTRTDARRVGWGVGGRLLVRAFEIKANKVTFGGTSAIAVYMSYVCSVIFCTMTRKLEHICACGALRYQLSTPANVRHA